jgi:lipopolysaccharide export LptBFGC system permease protein LptF
MVAIVTSDRGVQTNIMARTTAILGAVFVFAAVYLFLTFFGARALEDSPWAWIGLAIALVIAGFAGVWSYRASVRRSGRGLDT